MEIKIETRCQCIKKDGQKCLSNMIKTEFLFKGDEILIKPCCQVHSDWIISRILWKENAKKQELKDKIESKKKFLKLYSDDARNGIRMVDAEIETIRKELSIIHYDECRQCGYPIERDEKKSLVFAYSTNNTFRHAIHLHVKCEKELKMRLGHYGTLEEKPEQVLLSQF